MTQKTANLQAILDNHLCTGCGACAAIVPDTIEMAETQDENRRPHLKQALNSFTEQKIQSVCPSLSASTMPDPKSILESAWGPVLEVWQGHAVDEHIRYKASSGGAITALALNAIERSGFHGALHIKACKSDPTRNEARISQNRHQLLEGAGSRYAPASICDKLHLITGAAQKTVVIGKPCDIAGALSVARFMPEVKEKMGLTISIFCAGTPSNSGTSKLLQRLSPSKPGHLLELNYRGDGWPGKMRTKWQIGNKIERQSISYEEGWGEILQQHRQWRCHTCNDHTGEYADISVGDPWQTPRQHNKIGQSLIIVRTERGRKAVRKAQEDGYLVIEKQEPNILFDAQPNLFSTKGAVWGRSVALSTCGIQAPTKTKASFNCWMALPITAKMQSILGTIKRIIQKRLRHAHPTKWLPKGYFSR
ncbi:MAG: Coenzyme F420 hydrogenase/dehydrogenase, beta subunit C-terminal domain [Kordiimonadaceae bacterium]|nr:Coenzyme F420 hydrogenase/dehydrogenase, beta subunit C-terminal domain [Kordiimonadaceae bacterium]